MIRILVTAVVAASLGPAVAAGASSHPAPRAAAYTVTMSASDRAATVGDVVKLSGRVNPTAGAEVVIQKKVKQSWKTLGKRALRPNGTYVYRFNVTSVGRTTYRAVVPATRQRAQGLSPTVAVDGYRWRYLSQMAWHEDGDWESGAATIKGHRYAESVWADNNFWGDMEVNLDGKCTYLRGTAGLTSDSDSGSIGTLSVLRDGSEIYAHEFDMTTTDAVALAIKGTLRLALHNTTETGSTFPVVGVGNAQVYCKR